jgi:hypothetical protein
MLFWGKIRLVWTGARPALYGLVFGVTPLTLAAADLATPASLPATTTSAANTPASGTPAATTSSANTSAAGTPAPAAATASAPPVIPVSVPDNVNPFAGQTKPAPLKLPAPIPLSIDIKPATFDGLATLQMFVNGPDFNWMFDPLDDWILAPVGVGESAALIYKLKPEIRLSLTLYPAELMPDLTPAQITQYLAAVREPNPDDFVLLSPIPPGAGNLEITYFSSFRGQGVAYAIVGANVLIHHQWFVDLNHEYVLVVDLACPQALLDRLDPQVRFTLGRSRVLKGLGVDETKTPALAPPADSGTVPVKPTQ